MARPLFLPLVAAACGIATFSIMDALMKRASIEAGVHAALLWRNIIGAGIGIVVWQIVHPRAWPGRRMVMHAMRASVTSGMAFAFFWGIVRTPMAVGMALSFIAPIIALFMAGFALGEAITRRALGASALGLLGVGVIGLGRMQSGGAMEPQAWQGMAAILGSAVLYAANLVMQRHQAQMAPPAEIAFFQSLFTAMFLALAGLMVGLPPVPQGEVWRDIGGAAGLSFVSLMLLSWGWARAPAHRLLPVEYSAFLWAALMGWIWFGERLDIYTLGGAALVVAGCWVGAGGHEGGQKGDHTEQVGL
ncbi:DMT family transporter [Novosphingobium sediminicola]|jgi:S-adenosylmethionine uptake transporter|nr:DMT family transporter [Novosphingobium sediminicola]